jgi:hypothetical protein
MRSEHYLVQRRCHQQRRLPELQRDMSGAGVDRVQRQGGDPG